MGIGATLSRALLALAAAVVLPASAGAWAEPRAAKETLPSLAADLYVAVTQKQSSDVVAPLLERSVLKAGHECVAVRDYQILPAQGDTHILKVKCAEHPTYAMTISTQQGVRVAGGDGTIHPIDPQDGPVTAVWGMRAENYLAGEARSRASTSMAEVKKRAVKTVAAATLPAEETWDYGLMASVLLTLLLALPLVIWFNLRPSQVMGFTSEDKDQLVEEAQEVLPEIYRHPEGLFIVRGQRGKRRVFRSLLSAYLYRNYGLKLREVR
ncbi:MAG TPA: hypothetical protein VIG90_06350 [Pedomonas sp.]|uniref:hypothetical protein n=1 Tax=Pedomonas sp. TaxID=2976421 RepID=UPI002F42E07C